MLTTTLKHAVFVAGALLPLLMLGGCSRSDGQGIFAVTRDSGTLRGKALIEEKRCGSCHTIPGIAGARGMVGPPLTGFGRRTFIAGEMPNTPANLARWVQSPTSVEPKTAMPDLGLTERQAQDVAAYLYTLR